MSRYTLTIHEAYSPRTIPMKRLAEYMGLFARLMGQTEYVHFADLREGSCALATTVDEVAEPKVEARFRSFEAGNETKEAAKARQDLDDALREDNATGRIEADAWPGIVLVFPGRDAPQPVTYGPIRKAGHLDGQVILVGGRDKTVPVHIHDGTQVWHCNATRSQARELARYLFGTPIRVHGVGSWVRNAERHWVQDGKFQIQRFEVLSNAALRQVVAQLREVQGSGWRDVPDPGAELEHLRKGN